MTDFFNPTRPNNFTRAMGELIKAARKERSMSQEELADLIYRRRGSLSEIENGKMEPDASTLYYLAYALEKPILYFFGEPYRSRLETSTEALTTEQQELLKEFNRLESPALQKAAIQQIRALANAQMKEE